MPTITLGISGMTCDHCATTAQSARVDDLRAAKYESILDGNDSIQLVTDADTGRLIGAQVLAPEVGEMIQAAALAIRNNQLQVVGCDL